MTAPTDPLSMASMVSQVSEADYLVVGAGAAGMAFTDALIANADVSIAVVDRRHNGEADRLDGADAYTDASKSGGDRFALVQQWWTAESTNRGRVV